MARNKYPEKTIEKILDVSFDLFSKKGYDKTTIQDIVDAMEMSKGAIYHHFKSKEDIMEALSRRSYIHRNSYEQENRNLSGLEKIKFFFRNEFQSNDKKALDRMSSSLVRVPQFLAIFLKNNMEENAVDFTKMIEEGVVDGSIQVKDPQMVAEVVMMLLNIWANPFLWDRDESVFERQIRMIDTITRNLGFPFLDEELIAILKDYYKKMTAE